MKKLSLASTVISLISICVAYIVLAAGMFQNNMHMLFISMCVLFLAAFLLELFMTSKKGLIWICFMKIIIFCIPVMYIVYKYFTNNELGQESFLIESISLFVSLDRIQSNVSKVRQLKNEIKQSSVTT